MVRDSGTKSVVRVPTLSRHLEQFTCIQIRVSSGSKTKSPTLVRGIQTHKSVEGPLRLHLPRSSEPRWDDVHLTESGVEGDGGYLR